MRCPVGTGQVLPSRHAGSVNSTHACSVRYDAIRGAESGTCDLTRGKDMLSASESVENSCPERRNPEGRKKLLAGTQLWLL